MAQKIYRETLTVTHKIIIRRVHIMTRLTYFSISRPANMSASVKNNQLLIKMDNWNNQEHPRFVSAMDKNFYRSLSPVNFELASASKEDITYKLFTEPNQKEGNAITTENVDVEIKNKSIPTVLIIHGWLTDDTSPWFNPLKEALFKIGAHNVIFVNWQKAGGKNFNVSSANAKPVGKYMAEFLKNSQVPPENIHLVATSLGSQLTSFIGRSVKEITGKLVGRITGLDPAGPKFCHPAMTEKLSKEDAEFVDIIHSDIEYYGYAKPMGHVDFYPNGGVHQPGCPSREKDDNCSHARCLFYYVESVTKKAKAFEATYEEKGDEYIVKKIEKGKEVTFGHHVGKSSRGVFYLETNSSQPFLNV